MVKDDITETITTDASDTIATADTVAMAEDRNQRGKGKRELLLERKRRMSGYRTRALQSGVDKRTIMSRIFTNSDVKRMMKFCPPDDTLSYSEEEFQRRRMLSATPVTLSVAKAMGPTIDALAKRICDTAARAAYVAGRPSMQPYDILNASRGVLAATEFSVVNTDGLARFAQTHDSRGRPVSERVEGEDARLPMMDFIERDIDHQLDDARTIRAYGEISGAVNRWVDAKKNKKKKKGVDLSVEKSDGEKHACQTLS